MQAPKSRTTDELRETGIIAATKDSTIGGLCNRNSDRLAPDNPAWSVQ